MPAVSTLDVPLPASIIDRHDALPTNATQNGAGLKVFATRTEGGGGISVGAIVGIIIVVVLAIGLVIGIFVRNRHRNRSQPSYYPSQKKSFFALAPTQPQQQYLPTYVQPSTTYGHHNHGGVTMPQAVHPATGGYYARAAPGQGEDRVRFGQVGVVRF